MMSVKFWHPYFWFIELNGEKKQEKITNYTHVAKDVIDSNCLLMLSVCVQNIDTYHHLWIPIEYIKIG